MHRARYFPGSVSEAWDCSGQGERPFPLLTSYSSRSSSTENSQRKTATVGLLPSSASLPLSFLPLSKSALPATLMAVPCQYRKGGSVGGTHAGSCRLSRFPKKHLGVSPAVSTQCQRFGLHLAAV